MDWTGLIKHGLTVFLFCQKLLLFFRPFSMIKNCFSQWIIQQQKFSTEKMRAIWTIIFKWEQNSKYKNSFRCVSLCRWVCFYQLCVLEVHSSSYFYHENLANFNRKSTLNFMLHWLGNYPRLHSIVESTQAYPLNRLFEKMNLFIVVATTSIKIQICIPAHIMNSYQSSPVLLLLYAFV